MPETAYIWKMNISLLFRPSVIRGPCSSQQHYQQLVQLLLIQNELVIHHVTRLTRISDSLLTSHYYPPKIWKMHGGSIILSTLEGYPQKAWVSLNPYECPVIIKKYHFNLCPLQLQLCLVTCFNSHAAMIKLFWLNKMKQMLLQWLMKTRCKIVDDFKGGLIPDLWVKSPKSLLNHYPDNSLFRWIVLKRVFGTFRLPQLLDVPTLDFHIVVAWRKPCCILHTVYILGQYTLSLSYVVVH